MHVEDLRRWEVRLLAHRHRAREPVGERPRPLGPDRVRVDVVAGHAAQHGDQARERGDDLQRIAMRLDDARVGILGEERVERPEMARALQHPALRRTPPLEVLQLAAMRRVDPAQIGPVEPRLVARDAMRGREQHAREVVRGERDALLRQLRAHRVHRLEAGDQAVDARQMLVDRGDARVGLVGGALRRRPGMHHLPGHRHAVRRVLRQQLVQDRRPGPRQADDEERAFDPAGRDLGMRRVHGGHAQAILEQTDDIGTGDHAAERGEAGLGLEGVQQTPQRLAERRLAEVGEAGRPPRPGQQRLLVEPDDRQTRRAERAAQTVQETHGQRHRGAHGQHVARHAVGSQRPAHSGCHGAGGEK